MVVATDAPLLPHQLKRLARRVPLGLAATAAFPAMAPATIFIAFSTANKDAANLTGVRDLKMLPNDWLDAVFDATVSCDRRGHRQRDDRGAGYDRRRWSSRDGAAARSLRDDPEEIQPAGALARAHLLRHCCNRPSTRRAYQSVVRLREIFGPCSLIRDTSACGAAVECPASSNTRR